VPNRRNLNRNLHQMLLESTDESRLARLTARRHIPAEWTRILQSPVLSDEY